VQGMMPHAPCDPLPVFGTVWIKTNSSLTPAANIPVDVNFSYANNSNPQQWVAHTNGAGQYQVMSLPVGVSPGCLPVNGGWIRIWAETSLSNITHQNQTTIVYPQTSYNNGYLNDTLTYPTVKPVLAANVTSGESVLTVGFTGKTNGGSGSYATFNWHFGDGEQATSTNDSFNHNYYGVQTYYAHLIVNDSAGNSWETEPGLKITVNPAPSVTLAVTPKVFNISVAATMYGNDSGGTSPYAFTYTPGDGSGPFTNSGILITTNTETHTYTAVSGGTGTSGTVSVKDADNKVALSAPFTVWVYNVGIHPAYNPADAGVPIAFTGSALGGTGTYNYAWFWGDGSHSAAVVSNSGSHTYATSGIYTVTLQVNDTGHAPNMVDVTYSITINAAMVLTPSANPAATDVGIPVSFTGGLTGGTASFHFAWRYNDGQTTPSGAQNPVHTFNNSGTFTVKFWVNDSAGVSMFNTVVVTVSIQPIPTLDVENETTLILTTTGYVGETLEFQAGSVSGGTLPFQYNFAYGDTFTSGYHAAFTQLHAYAATGTYSATVTVLDAVGGTGTSTAVLVTIYAALASTSLTGNRTAGELNLAVSLTSSVTGGVPSLSYSWQYGDGNTLVSASGSQTHTYTKIENLTVNVTITDSQGEKVIQHLHIFVYGPLLVTIHSTRPVANFNPPLNVTYTSTITGGSFNYNSVNWNFGEGNTSATGKTVTYWHSGAYTITLTVADNASDHSAPTSSLTVYGSNTYVSLIAGWNLVTLPYVNTNYNMWFYFENMLLSGAVGTTTSLSVQNTAGAGNISFPLAANANYAIGEARGIWVDVASGVSVRVSGNTTAGPLSGSTSLQAGWNNLGWALSSSEWASALASAIPGATMISIWNAGTQTYTTYIANFDTPMQPPDYQLTDGQGVLVYVPAATSFTE